MTSGSPKPRRRKSSSDGVRTMARWMFYTHLWLGVIVTFLTISLSVTGIMLNHKRAMGFMPGTDVERPEALSVSLRLPELARLATAAVGPDAAAAGIDRMDVRPGDGIIKVRFDDSNVTEVTLALDDGEVLVVGLRNDVFLEKLHSGEIFGDAWVLLSDFGAVALILLLLTGFWIWLYPRARAR